MQKLHDCKNSIEGFYACVIRCPSCTEEKRGQNREIIIIGHMGKISPRYRR